MNSTSPGDDPGRDSDGFFHLFVYGTLRSEGGASGLLDGCERVGEASVPGTLYDAGEFPALMLYGTTPVPGEVWRCPWTRLATLDAYEGVERKLFRRAGVMAGPYPCWAYIAGPALARQLTPDRRLPTGVWRPGTDKMATGDP